MRLLLHWLIFCSYSENMKLQIHVLCWLWFMNFAFCRKWSLRHNSGSLGQRNRGVLAVGLCWDLHHYYYWTRIHLLEQFTFSVAWSHSFVSVLNFDGSVELYVFMSIDIRIIIYTYMLLNIYIYIYIYRLSICWPYTIVLHSRILLHWLNVW